MNGASYTWVYCDSAFSQVPFQSQQSFTPLQSGTYAVIVSLNGCEDTSICLPVVLTEKENDISGSGIYFYPNPVSESLQINLGTGNATESQIRLNDALGKTIFEETMSHKSPEINFSSFPAGIYFLVIRNGYAVHRFRVVKE